MDDASTLTGDSYTPVMGSIPIDRLAQEATPDYGVDTAKMKADLTDVARRKVADTEGAVDRQLQAQTSNYAKLTSKLDGVSPLDVKPWDADKERADRVRSPLDDFGSLASVFAMVASAFTKTPMDSALNAGAAAINSARANDLDGYDRAHTAWKENTDLALKRHEVEREAFKDAAELYSKDPIAGGAELKAVAAKYGAQAELSMIEAGYIDKVFEIQKTKSEAAQKLLSNMPKLAELDSTTRLQMLTKKATDEEAARLGRPLTAMEQAQIVGNVKRAALEDIGTINSSKQELFDVDTEARRRVKAAEDKGEALTIEDARLQVKQERKDALGNASTRERSASIEKAKQEWLAVHPEANGVVPSEVENKIRGQASARSVVTSEPNLSDSAAKLTAERVVAGDKSAMAGLGFGSVGAANRAKVLDIVSRISEERGIDGAGLARNALEYNATGAGARSMAQQEARVVSAISKAQATAPRVLEASDKVDRTKFPTINSLIMSAQKGSGGENVVRLGIAVETFINNYALALGGGNSAMTDSSKQHARELLEKNYSKGQMRAAVDQMMIEMNSELSGLKSGLKTYLSPHDATPAPAGWSIKKM